MAPNASPRAIRDSPRGEAVIAVVAVVVVAVVIVVVVLAWFIKAGSPILSEYESFTNGSTVRVCATGQADVGQLGYHRQAVA